jgi:16S rRNA G966 N2-methylase RsmD
MQLKDALFNWLQIQVVWDKRPSDRSAKDTAHFFEEMLREEHQVTIVEKKVEGGNYVITYEQAGEQRQVEFPRDMADKLLNDIINEPKYNQSFED